jgi:hypothetical protein
MAIHMLIVITATMRTWFERCKQLIDVNGNIGLKTVLLHEAFANNAFHEFYGQILKHLGIRFEPLCTMSVPGKLPDHSPWKGVV